MYKFAHFNFNVFDLEKSITFYNEALGLVVKSEIVKEDFKIVYLTDLSTSFTLELTYLNDQKEPYNLGDNEIHLALSVEDFNESYQKHKAMGCICYENAAMGIYFINDPDGYWIEIIPTK